MCKENTLKALLGSPTTAEMNAITHDAVFSLYPRLTYANEALVVGRITSAGVGIGELRVGGGVKIYRNNSHWTKPCGLYCPMRRRKTYDDEGVARYRWCASQDDLNVYNKWGNATTDEPARGVVTEWDLMYSSMETWQVFDKCQNPHCEHAVKYDRRSQYVKV